VNDHDSDQSEEIDLPAWALEGEGLLLGKADEYVSEKESAGPNVEAASASHETQAPAEPASESSTKEPSEQSETLTPQLLHALGVLSPSMVDRICADETTTEFLIEGFLPAKSIAIVGGDSGIGKSPLICQLALCLAAGIPFLGLETHQGRVLYFDLENSLVDCKAMRDALTGFLGLREAPYHDFLLVPEPADFKRLNELIEKVRPRLIVIDSLRALAPHATEKNAAAGEWLKEIRNLVRKYGCAFLIVHHLRKPKLDISPSDLAEETRAMDWLLEMEGPRAFVNQTDVRIAVANGDGKLVALKAKWSRRVRGDSPLYLLERVFEEGEPVGYRPLTGRDFLNPEQQRALDRLPDRGEWGFREARQALGEATSVDTHAMPAPANRTGELLQRCIHHQVIEKLSKNRYRKVQKPGVAGVKS
jgi:AAA domain